MDIYRAALPLIRALPAEPAHDLTLRLLEYGLAPAPRPMAEPLSLAIDLWGRRFPNPVGLAAGFDKMPGCRPACCASASASWRRARSRRCPRPATPSRASSACPRTGAW